MAPNDEASESLRPLAEGSQPPFPKMAIVGLGSLEGLAPARECWAWFNEDGTVDALSHKPKEWSDPRWVRMVPAPVSPSLEAPKGAGNEDALAQFLANWLPALKAVVKTAYSLCDDAESVTHGNDEYIRIDKRRFRDLCEELSAFGDDAHEGLELMDEQFKAASAAPAPAVQGAPEPCIRCGGSGFSGDNIRCSACSGTGVQGAPTEAGLPWTVDDTATLRRVFTAIGKSFPVSNEVPDVYLARYVREALAWILGDDVRRRGEGGEKKPIPEAGDDCPWEIIDWSKDGGILICPKDGDGNQAQWYDPRPEAGGAQDGEGVESILATIDAAGRFGGPGDVQRITRPMWAWKALAARLRSLPLSEAPAESTRMLAAWRDLRASLEGSDKWPVGDAFQHKEFFRHGWIARGSEGGSRNPDGSPFHGIPGKPRAPEPTAPPVGPKEEG